MAERRLLEAYGTADALIITDPQFWPCAAYYRRLAKIMAYHISDDYAAYPHVRRESEGMLARHADIFFPVSTLLAQAISARYGVQDSVLHVLPNGLPSSWLPSQSPSLQVPRPVPPADLLPADFRPLVGIIGVIGSRIDLLPIVAAHNALPDLRWVFIGPVRHQLPGLAELMSSPRCRFLGPIPYRELQPCFACLDAAVLPFTDDDINPCSSPVRFFSQLPTGQPILYTGSCHQIAETPELAYHCADAGALVAILADLAARGFDDGRAVQRHRFAAGCTWERRAAAMADALTEALQARRGASGRLRTAPRGRAAGA